MTWVLSEQANENFRTLAYNLLELGRAYKHYQKLYNNIPVEVSYQFKKVAELFGPDVLALEVPAHLITMTKVQKRVQTTLNPFYFADEAVHNTLLLETSTLEGMDPKLHFLIEDKFKPIMDLITAMQNWLNIDHQEDPYLANRTLTLNSVATNAQELIGEILSILPQEQLEDVEQERKEMAERIFSSPPNRNTRASNPQFTSPNIFRHLSTSYTPVPLVHDTPLDSEIVSSSAEVEDTEQDPFEAYLKRTLGTEQVIVYANGRLRPFPIEASMLLANIDKRINDMGKSNIMHEQRRRNKAEALGLLKKLVTKYPDDSLLAIDYVRALYKDKELEVGGVFNKSATSQLLDQASLDSMKYEYRVRDSNTLELSVEVKKINKRIVILLEEKKSFFHLNTERKQAKIHALLYLRQALIDNSTKNEDQRKKVDDIKFEVWQKYPVLNEGHSSRTTEHIFSNYHSYKLTHAEHKEHSVTPPASSVKDEHEHEPVTPPATDIVTEPPKESEGHATTEITADGGDETVVEPDPFTAFS